MPVGYPAAYPALYRAYTDTHTDTDTDTDKDKDIVPVPVGYPVGYPARYRAYTDTDIETDIVYSIHTHVHTLPVPVGSPPCSMKFLMLLWKMVSAGERVRERERSRGG